MTEFENVKDALEDAIGIAESNRITIQTKEGSFRAEATPEMMRERLYNIADLLGMSDLYLKD